MEGDIFSLFIFTETVVKAHLLSFSVMYNNLKNWKEGKKTAKHKIVLAYLYNLILRLLIGISKNIIKNSFNWSLKFSSYSNKIGLSSYFLTILKETFKDFIIIENMRIYSNKKSWIEFNPPKGTENVKNILNFIKENPEKMKKAQNIFNDSIFGEFVNAVSLESTNGVIKEPNSNKKHSAIIVNLHDNTEERTIIKQSTKDGIYFGKEGIEVLNPLCYKFTQDPRMQFSTQPHKVNLNSVDIYNGKFSLEDPRTLAQQPGFNEVTAAYLIALKKYNKFIELDKTGKYKITDENNTYLGTLVNNSLGVHRDINRLNSTILKSANEVKKFEESLFVKLSKEDQLAFVLNSMNIYNPEFMPNLEKFFFNSKTDTNQIVKINFNKTLKNNIIVKSGNNNDFDD